MNDKIDRVIRTKEEAIASYNRISRWFDILAEHWEKRFKDTGLQKLRIEEGETVLEIGFGTGRCLLALAQAAGNSGRVYGIDISPGMLNITWDRVVKAGLSPRVILKNGDAVALPFTANFFNAIFISFTLELFDTPEIPIVLKECQRILHGGGRICVVAMSKRRGVSLVMKFYEWAHRRFPRYFDCRPIFVSEALKDSGFQIIDASEKSFWGWLVEIVTAKKK